jgi:purine-binding chemotaxis protein CheW
MEELEYTERTCIIVVEIDGQTGTILIGIVVDAVSEVLNIKSEDMEDTRHFRRKIEYPIHFGHGQDGRRCKDSAGY